MRSLSVLLSTLLCLTASLCAANAAPEAMQASAVRGAPTPAPAAGAGPHARELAAVRAAEQQRAEAVANRDIATLRKLISGDYYHVESGGRARTKTEFLQLLTRGEFEFRSYEVDDMEIRMLDNGRAAVVTGRFRAEAQGANRPRQLRGRYVRMWVLGPEGWRNTMQQSTEIRVPALALP